MTDANSSPLQKLIVQFLSYIAVGGTAFAIDFGVLYFLTEHVGIYYIVSATAGFLVGLVVKLSALYFLDIRLSCHKQGLT